MNLKKPKKKKNNQQGDAAAAAAHPDSSPSPHHTRSVISCSRAFLRTFTRWGRRHQLRPLPHRPRQVNVQRCPGGLGLVTVGEVTPGRILRSGDAAPHGGGGALFRGLQKRPADPVDHGASRAAGLEPRSLAPRGDDRSGVDGEDACGEGSRSRSRR